MALVIILMAGCTDGFEELNKNPNDPSDVEISNVLPSVIRSLSVEYTSISFDVTNKLMQYSVRQEAEADKYDIEGVYPFWSNTYSSIRNLNYVIDNSPSGYEYYHGVALVVKSWMFYLTTNFYGDAPYGEAGKGMDKKYKPGYDQQKDIYTGMIADLEQANTLLSKEAYALKSDLLLGNDVMKWRRFANSLRVRILMSQSRKVDPTVALKAIIDHPETYPLMTGNEDIPKYGYLADVNNRYPRYDNSGWTESTKMCATLLDQLQALGDERLKAYCDTVANPAIDDKYIGLPAGEDIVFDAFDVSGQSHLIRKSDKSPVVKTVWMSYAELQFLLAEACEKGYIDGGTAKAEEYYTKAVSASHMYWQEMVEKGIQEELPLMAMNDISDAYWEQSDVAYVGNKEDKLKKISKQFWLASFNDLEGYFYWRRTGNPVLTPGSRTLNNQKIPVRLKYPAETKLYNTDQYKAAVQRQGADDLNTHIWSISE